MAEPGFKHVSVNQRPRFFPLSMLSSSRGQRGIPKMRGSLDLEGAVFLAQAGEGKALVQVVLALVAPDFLIISQKLHSFLPAQLFHTKNLKWTLSLQVGFM